MDYRKEQEKHAKRRARIFDLWKNGEGKPVRTIANAYGISPERVRQIIKMEGEARKKAATPFL